MAADAVLNTGRNGLKWTDSQVPNRKALNVVLYFPWANGALEQKPGDPDEL